jgi:hypothetical protein
MALTRLGPNNSTNISGINLTSQVTGTLPTGNGGTGATSFAPGKLLQIQYTNYNTSVSTSDQGYVTTGLTCAITPSATNSKIFGMFKLQARGNGITSSYEWGYACKVDRSGGASGTIFEEKGGTGQAYSTYFYANANTTQIAQHSSFQFLDTTHNTTSAITYTVFAKVMSGNQAVNFQNATFPSQFTLMEVAA